MDRLSPPKLYFDRSIADFGFNLFWEERDRCHPDKRYFATSVCSEEVDRSTLVSPLCTITEEEAEHIMNQLWTLGVRPSEKIIEPLNRKHIEEEVYWMRGVIDKFLDKIE